MRYWLSFFLFFISCISEVTARSYEDAQAHAVVFYGTPQDVYKLVKSGYDLRRPYQCQTLLTTAIKSMAENLAVDDRPEESFQKIQILLNNGASYNQKACKKTSLTPIFWAVSLPLLLQQTENELNEGLDESIKNGTDYCDIPKIVSKPCKQVTPEEREQIRAYFHRMTVASIKKLNPYFAKLIKTLIKRGVDLSQTDELGQTVLHYAAAIPKEITTEPLRLLLEKGIFVDSQNPQKQTPLFFAYGAHNQAAVNLLLDAGADPTMRDIDGILPKESKGVILENTSHEDGSISVHLEN